MEEQSQGVRGGVAGGAAGGGVGRVWRRPRWLVGCRGQWRGPSEYPARCARWLPDHGCDVDGDRLAASPAPGAGSLETRLRVSLEYGPVSAPKTVAGITTRRAGWCGGEASIEVRCGSRRRGTESGRGTGDGWLDGGGVVGCPSFDVTGEVVWPFPPGLVCAVDESHTVSWPAASSPR